jgi:hypothetical protein
MRPNPTMKAAAQKRSWATRATGPTGARMASFASYERASRDRAIKTIRTARFTQSDALSRPAGRRGSTMVNKTLAPVDTTTISPKVKRNQFIAARPSVDTTSAFGCLHPSRPL